MQFDLQACLRNAFANTKVITAAAKALAAQALLGGKAVHPPELEADLRQASAGAVSDPSRATAPDAAASCHDMPDATLGTDSPNRQTDDTSHAMLHTVIMHRLTDNLHSPDRPAHSQAQQADEVSVGKSELEACSAPSTAAAGDHASALQADAKAPPEPTDAAATAGDPTSGDTKTAPEATDAAATAGDSPSEVAKAAPEPTDAAATAELLTTKGFPRNLSHRSELYDNSDQQADPAAVLTEVLVPVSASPKAGASIPSNSGGSPSVSNAQGEDDQTGGQKSRKRSKRKLSNETFEAKNR